MAEQEELATMLAKAQEILQTVANRLKGGKHSPVVPMDTEAAVPANRPSFRDVKVRYYDVGETERGPWAKIKTWEDEVFWINDQKVLAAIDPVLLNSRIQLQFVKVTSPKTLKVSNQVVGFKKLDGVLEPGAKEVDDIPF